MRSSTMTVAGLLGLAVLLLGAGLAEGANLTWNNVSGDWLWNTTSANWVPPAGGTTYSDGDNVRFDSEAYPASCGTVTIVPASVAPRSVLITGQRAPIHWTFQGGDIVDFDIANPTTVTHDWGNRDMTFTGGDATGNYNFTGGVFIKGTSSGATMVYTPKSGAATTHRFGTADINVSWRYSGFRFNPTDAGDRLSNNFVFNGGGWRAPQNGGVLDGTVTLAGTLYIDVRSGTAHQIKNTFILTGDRTILHDAHVSQGWFTIDGPITSSGSPRSLTIEESGDNYAWYAQLGDNGGANAPMDILNFVSRNSTGRKGTLKILADERTYFTKMRDNGGAFIVSDNSVVSFNRSTTIELNFPLRVRSTAIGFQTNTTINVNAGGVIGGDGAFVKDRGGIYSNNFDDPMTININAGGKLSPGMSIGATTLYGNLNLTASSILDFEFDGISSDRMLVRDAPGTASVTEGKLVLDGILNISGNIALGTYTLFQYEGLLTNNGLEIGAAPANFVYTIQAGAGVVTLTASELPVPEPATALLVAAACLLLHGCRRNSSSAR